MVEQVHDAKEAGADAVILCAPRLFAWHAGRHPHFGITQVRAVADAVAHAPVVLFQYSPNNRFYYRPEVLARIGREFLKSKASRWRPTSTSAYEEEVRAGCAVPRKVFLLPANGRTQLDVVRRLLSR